MLPTRGREYKIAKIRGFDEGMALTKYLGSGVLNRMVAIM
jgi:hypothetical protein